MPVMPPVIRTNNRRFVCILKGGIKAVILTVSIVHHIVVVVVIIIGVVASLSRVTSNGREVWSCHLVFIHLGWCRVERDALGMTMQGSAFRKFFLAADGRSLC